MRKAITSRSHRPRTRIRPTASPAPCRHRRSPWPPAGTRPTSPARPPAARRVGSGSGGGDGPGRQTALPDGSRGRPRPAARFIPAAASAGPPSICASSASVPKRGSYPLLDSLGCHRISGPERGLRPNGFRPWPLTIALLPECGVRSNRRGKPIPGQSTGAGFRGIAPGAFAALRLLCRLSGLPPAGSHVDCSEGSRLISCHT
jgi:hypothetical protein